MTSQQQPTPPLPISSTENGDPTTEQPRKGKPLQGRPHKTFYRRPLPDSCVALSSPKGRKYFESALRHNGLKTFFPLMEQFTTQSEPAYCGVSTLVIVLNALSVDPRRTWKGPWRWYTESMLNCCMDLEEVKRTGITLRTFSCLGRCQGLHVSVTYAENCTSLQDFREAVQLACVEVPVDNEQETEEGGDAGLQNESEQQLNGTSSKLATMKNPYLVASYNRKVLGQTGTGHFSPIAAYDAASDSVLILDTARFKYGPHWVPLPLLYEAMLPIDPDTGNSRGFALLSYEPEDPDTWPQMPISILLNSRTAQSPTRKAYRDFLVEREDEVRWSQVVDWWTQGGTRAKHIFDMMEPQLTPLEPDIETCVHELRDAVGQLICIINDSDPDAKYDFPAIHKDCRKNLTRTICLAPQEAIFLVYLASLSPERRREIVYDERLEHVTNLTRQRILTEVELVQYAIDAAEELMEEQDTLHDPLEGTTTTNSNSGTCENCD